MPNVTIKTGTPTSPTVREVESQSDLLALLDEDFGESFEVGGDPNVTFTGIFDSIYYEPDVGGELVASKDPVIGMRTTDKDTHSIQDGTVIRRVSTNDHYKVFGRPQDDGTGLTMLPLQNHTPA